MRIFGRKNRKTAAFDFMVLMHLLLLLPALAGSTAPVDSHNAKTRPVPHKQLIEKLVRQGYENVIVQTGAPVTLLSFEDVSYRQSVRGLKQAIRQAIFHLPPTDGHVFVILQKYGVPVAGFASRDVETIEFQNGRKIALPHLEVGDPLVYWRYFRPFYPANSSVFKSDLIIHPNVRAMLGNYDNPVALQLNLIPELRLVLFAGGVLSASAIAPLYNELESFGNTPRLGPTNMNYFRALPNGFWFYTSFGYFYDERYGAQAQIRKLSDRGRWAVDARIGWTGYAVMDHGSFIYSPMATLTWSLETTYFFRNLRLFVSGGYHQFLEQDLGWRFDMYRFFGHLRLGFWAGTGAGQWNGGFRVALPLPPSRYRPRQKFRLRMADTMRIGYVGRREITTGRILENSELMDDLLIDSFPGYLQSHIDLQK